MSTLDSPRSPAVLAARSLLRRSGRQERGLFLVEGPQAVREARDLRELFFTGAAADRYPSLVRDAARAGARTHECTDRALAALSETVTPQGLVGVAPLVGVSLERALAGSPRLVVVGVGVADPGNAGTLVRTADAAGADAIVLTGGSVDPHNGKAVRASAGSLFHLPVCVGPQPSEVLPALADAGLQVLATTGHAGAADLDDLLDEGALARPTAWLLGSEARGLPSEVLAAADAQVRIPLHGRAESLNMAAAAAVVLYATARAQRRCARQT